MTLLYVNPNAARLIRFAVPGDMDMAQAFRDNALDRRLNTILEGATHALTGMGASYPFPQELSAALEESELDSMLLLLERHPQQLLCEQVYVQIPRQHATFFYHHASGRHYRSLGVNASGFLLDFKESQRTRYMGASFEELRSGFSMMAVTF